MATNYNPQIVKDSLVLHLDALNTKSYLGGGIAWKNLVGPSIATLINGVTFNSGALVFDGLTQYASTTLTRTADCSFSVWASTTETTFSDMLFNAGNNGAGPDLFFSGTSLYWNTWDSANNPFTTFPSGFNDGNMHNYVVVNDSATNAKLYYDGELIGTANYRSATTSTNLYIGGTTATYQWKGNIATFSVNNKVLSPEEVKQNFNALRGRFGI